MLIALIVVSEWRHPVTLGDPRKTAVGGHCTGAFELWC